MKIHAVSIEEADHRSSSKVSIRIVGSTVDSRVRVDRTTSVKAILRTQVIV